MDNLFLSREVGSIETGPQTFADTNVLDTTFYFNSVPEPFGLLNSVLVQGAGLNTLNGTFNYTTEFDDKPYYNKDGESRWFIVSFENQWRIYDFLITNIDPIYYSNENVPYPWNVTTWLSISPEYNPTPIVTKVL